MMARRGIPIGNVTSQIFANIYLHELDRFVKHDLRMRGYLRYGDDFVLFAHDRESLERAKRAIEDFLHRRLRLQLHPRNNILLPCRQGLHFLGYEIFPQGRRLRARTWRRLRRRLNARNLSSYRGLVLSEGNAKQAKRFAWYTAERMRSVE